MHGANDPQASDVLYIKALAAPFTGNTTPGETSIALGGTRSRTQSWRKTATTARISWPGSPRLVKKRKDSTHDNTSRAAH